MKKRPWKFQKLSLWPWESWNFENIQTSFNVFNYISIVKISALYHSFEKLTLDWRKINRFDLEWIRISKIWKKLTFFHFARRGLCSNLMSLSLFYRFIASRNKVANKQSSKFLRTSSQDLTKHKQYYRANLRKTAIEKTGILW